MAYRSRVAQQQAARRHYEANKALHKSRAREHTDQQRAALATLVAELKAVPCADCGERYPAYVMDFDHVNGEKDGNIAELVSAGVSTRRLLAEVEKCEVVCANCHRQRTFDRRTDRLVDRPSGALTQLRLTGSVGPANTLGDAAFGPATGSVMRAVLPETGTAERRGADRAASHSNEKPRAASPAGA